MQGPNPESPLKTPPESDQVDTDLSKWLGVVSVMCQHAGAFTCSVDVLFVLTPDECRTSDYLKLAEGQCLSQCK